MGFEASWLDLRESADRQARDNGLLRAAVALSRGAGACLDLGSGTGATLRAFETAGAQDVTWRIVDHDPALLAIARKRHPAVQVVQIDLAACASTALDGVDLVTASALLDLVSEDWLMRLADDLACREIAFYAALSYDGRISWSPCDPRDEAVRSCFNAHQQTDKGFGPALGPSAARRAAEIFRERGFVVRTARSDWCLGPEEARLQQMLLTGIAAAASETGYANTADWAATRTALMPEGQVQIGHVDILAEPRRVAAA